MIALVTFAHSDPHRDVCFCSTVLTGLRYWVMTTRKINQYNVLDSVKCWGKKIGKDRILSIPGWRQGGS